MSTIATTTVIDPRIRSLVTPEGVDLRVRLATASERAGALLIDLTILVAALIALTFIVIGAASDSAAAGAFSIAPRDVAMPESNRPPLPKWNWIP